MELEGLKEYFWTDSKVVLGYINNDDRRFHVFVANRIQQIKSSTEPSQWQYVASENNPADHASRGLTTKELTGLRDLISCGKRTSLRKKRLRWESSMRMTQKSKEHRFMLQRQRRKGD